MKAWHKSKTIWLNVIGAVLVALEASFGILQPLIPANSYAVLSVALAVSNAALRVITTQAIK